MPIRRDGRSPISTYRFIFRTASRNGILEIWAAPVAVDDQILSAPDRRQDGMPQATWIVHSFTWLRDECLRLARAVFSVRTRDALRARGLAVMILSIGWLRLRRLPRGTGMNSSAGDVKSMARRCRFAHYVGGALVPKAPRASCLGSVPNRDQRRDGRSEAIALDPRV
jgi:hypothetical protein